MPLIDFLGGGKQQGDVSTGSAWARLIDSAGNGIAKAQRAFVSSTQEFLLVAGKNDDYATALRTDRKGNILTGNYIPELIENFEGVQTNFQKWSQTSASFVAAQSTTGGYSLNSTSITTANASFILQSQRYFYKFPRVPLQNKVRLRANIPTNSTLDLGFGLPTTNVLLVPNGACIRVVNGLWFAVITANSSEISIPIYQYGTTTQLNTSNTNSEYYVTDLIIDDDNLIATVQNTQTGVMVGYARLEVPLTFLKMFSATSLPTYVRLFNASAAPAIAPNAIIGEMQVLSLDWNINMDASQVAGNLGMTGGRNPYSGLQLANHTNSTAPVSATLSNTAAGYTTLGGKYQFAAIAGAVTDYCLFGFQVPVGSKFLCEGISISARNDGAAVAITPTVLEWAMGHNSANVSLASANIIRTEIPGSQSFVIASGIGASAPTIDINLITPEVTESGRFIQVILTMPTGTATALQVIRGQVLIKGRFI